MLCREYRVEFGL